MCGGPCATMRSRISVYAPPRVSAGRYLVEFRQIEVEHHALAANLVNLILNDLNIHSFNYL